MVYRHPLFQKQYKTDGILSRARELFCFHENGEPCNRHSVGDRLHTVRKRGVFQGICIVEDKNKEPLKNADFNQNWQVLKGLMVVALWGANGHARRVALFTP